jgi:DNA-binding XRE family transcriptional regulator
VRVCPLVYLGKTVDHGLVNETTALKIIGDLIREARVTAGFTKRPFAQYAGINTRTLVSMEEGERVAWETNQRKVEDALNWRAGAIQEVINNAPNIPPESVTMEFMKQGAGEETWQDLDAQELDLTKPVTRAGELSNEELIGELAYRLRNKSLPNFPTNSH